MTRFHAMSIAAVALALVSGASVMGQAPPRGSGDIHFRGFIRAIEGDTFEIYINGHQTGVGIIGIKAPNGNTICGRQATGYLWQLFADNEVTLEEDPSLTFDERKRRMYYVVLPDKSSAAVKMAATGTVVPSGQGRERQAIKEAADAASSPCVTQ